MVVIFFLSSSGGLLSPGSVRVELPVGLVHVFATLEALATGQTPKGDPKVRRVECIDKWVDCRVEPTCKKKNIVSKCPRNNFQIIRFLTQPTERWHEDVRWVHRYKGSSQVEYEEW